MPKEDASQKIRESKLINIKKNKLFFISLPLLFSCQSEKLSARDKFELDCINIFEDILKIQEERDYLSNNMQYISRLRKERSISKQKHKAFSQEWINKERYLRDKVTKIYDKAYAKGCFDERSNSLEIK